VPPQTKKHLVLSALLIAQQGVSALLHLFGNVQRPYRERMVERFLKANSVLSNPWAVRKHEARLIPINHTQDHIWNGKLEITVSRRLTQIRFYVSAGCPHRSAPGAPQPSS